MAKKPDKRTLQDLKPQTETLPLEQPTAETQEAAPPTTEEGVPAMAKKPQMEAKKDWDFELESFTEVPPISRAGTRAHTFPWDTAFKQKQKFIVKKTYWLEKSGLAEKQASDPARNKDAIRRSFYGWRDKDKKARGGFAIALSDKYEGKEYVGVTVYPAEAA